MSKRSFRSSERDTQTSRSERPNPDQKFSDLAEDIKHEVVRNQLLTTMGKKNAQLLEKSIDQYRAAETDPMITERAEEELQYLHIRDELYAAMEARDLDKMYEICQRVEGREYRRFKDPLTPDLMQARKLISILNRKVKMPERLDFDDKTMREMRRYGSPPQIVHDVAVAAFLLLGEYEGYMRDWNKCRELLKPYGQPIGFGAREGLRWRIENFDPQAAHPELAARAQQIISRYTLSHAYEVSEACAAFYVWTKTQLSDLKLEDVTAANQRRQREILGIAEKELRGGLTHRY